MNTPRTKITSLRTDLSETEYKHISSGTQANTCCIFLPAFGCCELQTLVEMTIFSVFCAKNLKKHEICSKFQQKPVFFEFAPERWSTVLFPKKRAFSSKNTFLPMKSFNNSLPCRDLNPGRPGEKQMTYQCATVLLYANSLTITAMPCHFNLTTLKFRVVKVKWHCIS